MTSAPDLSAHVRTVEKLWHLNPDRADALIKIAAITLKEEQEKLRPKRPAQTLLARLQAVHHCRKGDDAGFEQLPHTSSSAPVWRCNACGAEITLGENGGANG